MEKVLLENERVRIVDIKIEPNHSHVLKFAHPTITWQCTEGSHSFSLNGSPKTTQVVKDKNVCFYPAKSTIDITNTGASVYRQLIFEMLIPPKYSEAEFQGLIKRALHSTTVGDYIIFENEYCRVWDLVIPPGGGTVESLHQHVVDYAFVPYGPHPHDLIAHDVNSEVMAEYHFNDGDVKFSHIRNGGFEADGKTLEKWPTHWPENANKEFAFIEALVEFK